MELEIKPIKVLGIMLAIIAVLAVLHIAQLSAYLIIDDTGVFDYIRLLDFDTEGNLPTFYSALAILFCSVLLFIIYKNHTGKRWRFHWLGLAIIFLFLAFDEALVLHEELGDFTEQFINPSGFLCFAWVLPYGILLALFVISYFRFILHLPTRTRRLFVLAGALFVFGAIGLEVVSAREAGLHNTSTVFYNVLYTIEEFCEMLAMALFAYSLLDYIKHRVGAIKIHF